MDKNMRERYGEKFFAFLQELCSEKYIAFFSDASAEYMRPDGKTQPCYVGAAKEFCDLFSEAYNEIYFTAGFENAPLKDELDTAYGEHDYILQGDDMLGAEAINGLSIVEVVAVLSVIFDMEQFNCGYIAACGKNGVISNLLGRIKTLLSENAV